LRLGESKTTLTGLIRVGVTKKLGGGVNNNVPLRCGHVRNLGGGRGGEKTTARGGKA